MERRLITEKERKIWKNKAALFRKRHPERAKQLKMESMKRHPETKKNYDKNYSITHSESIKKRWQERYFKDSKKYKDYQMLFRYKITPEEYNVMFSKQEGRCAICKRHQDEFSRKLFVDHDHNKEKLRNLLCQGCNSGLGMFKENISSLKEAIKYLEKHNED